MWFDEILMLSLMAFSSRKRLMKTLTGLARASSFSKGIQIETIINTNFSYIQ